MQVRSDIQSAVEMLSKKQREAVEVIVRRHIGACYRNGVDLESIDRLYIEAMESVRLGHNVDEMPEPYLPRQQYTQYISPRGEA